MKETELRFRQIHLDFHTSETIESVGSDFEPDEFAETLVKANVNSISCFARCHHGWLYFNSKAFPERRHPHLTKGAAPPTDRSLPSSGNPGAHLHHRSVGSFHRNAPPGVGGCERRRQTIGTPPFEAGFYQTLCVNTPYREFLKEHTAEVLGPFRPMGCFLTSSFRFPAPVIIAAN